jgi:methyl-accepting chemotaxis protein
VVTVESIKSAEYKKTIDEQIEVIRAYVRDFDLIVPKDETALKELVDMMRAFAQSVKEMDDARIKRKQLLEELNRACGELEESHKKFADSVSTKTT